MTACQVEAMNGRNEVRNRLDLGRILSRINPRDRANYFINRLAQTRKNGVEEVHIFFIASNKCTGI